MGASVRDLGRVWFAGLLSLACAASALAQSHSWTTAEVDAGPSYRPAVAANRRAGEYLVVYETFDAQNDKDIHGRLTREDHQFVGAEFPIAGVDGEQALPDAAYDPSHRRYLVVWVDHRFNDFKGQIWGQLLSEDGSAIGGNFSIAGGPDWNHDYRSPAVACDGDGNFLVVCLEYETGAGRHAYATQVLWDGTIVGLPSPRLSQVAGGWVDLPMNWVRLTAASADPTRTVFVAAWVEKDASAPTTRNIAFRRIGESGDAQFVYASRAAGDEEQPGVACDPLSGEFLVVWKVQGGAIQGHRHGIADSIARGGVLGLSPGTLPAIAWDPAIGRYVLVFRTFEPDPTGETQGTHFTESRQVRWDGSLLPISRVDVSCSCCGPDVAANPFHPSDLAAYGKMAQGEHGVWQGYATDPTTFATGLGPEGSGWMQRFVQAPSGTFGNQGWTRLPWNAYNLAVGETRPAAGDTNGDGADELVVGLGRYTTAGGFALVLRSGPSGYVVDRWLRVPWSAYNASVAETRTACGDVDGDGRKEVVIGLGAGGAGMFFVFDDAIAGYGLLTTGRVPFASYNQARGETRPACGDSDGNGQDEVFIALGRGGAGWVARFGGAAGGTLEGWLRLPFPAYNADNGETWASVGDLDGDGRAEVALGTGAFAANGGFLAVLGDETEGHVLDTWLRMPRPAYNAGAAGGEVRPSVGQLDVDRSRELVVGMARGGAGLMARYDRAATGFALVGWTQVSWAAYNSSNGETRPAVGVFPAP